MNDNISNLTLNDENTHLPKLLEHMGKKHYLEENAIGIIGESGDYDIMSTYLSYVVGGESWGVDRQNLRLSAFMAVPKSSRGKMNDNDFISNRIDPVHSTGNMVVTMNDDHVDLDIDGQHLISRPPYWELKGEAHNGIKYDIVGKATGPAVWSLGKYEDMIENGMAGYDLGMSYEGSITANGVEYKLDPGTLGNRQYVTIGDKWVSGALLERYSKHAYIWATCENAEVFVWIKEATNMVLGRTVIDGETVEFAPEEVNVEELEHWVDPRSGLNLPVKWRVNMKNDKGHASLEITAYARYIYSFCQAGGVISYVAKLARSYGEVVQNGKKVDMVVSSAQVETGIYTLPLGVG